MPTGVYKVAPRSFGIFTCSPFHLQPASYNLHFISLSCLCAIAKGVKHKIVS